MNLPRPTVQARQLQQLLALGICTEQQQALYFYQKRGPQAMRRTIVRRLCKLLPPCEAHYVAVNKQCGLSSKGLQWAQEHCEKFFFRVLGDPRQPGSAPWPAVAEMKPKQELKYLARLLTWLLGGRMVVTAMHVNALFVPGFKEWKVDSEAVTHLLVPFICVWLSVVSGGSAR
ncbi:hypothetical protein OEZ85_003515 [Tetradesmus obliquus]|uniref:Uncharacterized protein n=1 Tax=Tetradesmus obliquus TaxID=3088 RepID=A0ABY8UBI4_TETOB|nr:hypothetical protein OEZ85_003515 [Tetradesmus obliquus]